MKTGPSPFLNPRTASATFRAHIHTARGVVGQFETICTARRREEG
jgi:hypothetical protein